MRFRKILSAFALAAVAAAGTSACATDDQAGQPPASCDPQQDADCELIPAGSDEDEADDTDPCTVAEQQERDDDCGQYDARGSWVLYPWVVPGVHSTPHPGWKRPAPARTAPTTARPRPTSSSRPDTRRPTSGSTTGKKTSGGTSRTSR